MRVVGIRGAFVGLIAEVTDDAIMVAPDDGADAYWLRRDAIFGVDDRRVELICDASEVHRYRLEGAPG
jgi:hypothetical protein